MLQAVISDIDKLNKQLIELKEPDGPYSNAHYKEFFEKYVVSEIHRLSKIKTYILNMEDPKYCAELMYEQLKKTSYREDTYGFEWSDWDDEPKQKWLRFATKLLDIAAKYHWDKDTVCDVLECFKEGTKSERRNSEQRNNVSSF